MQTDKPTPVGTRSSKEKIEETLAECKRAAEFNYEEKEKRKLEEERRMARVQQQVREEQAARRQRRHDLQQAYAVSGQPNSISPVASMTDTAYMGGGFTQYDMGNSTYPSSVRNDWPLSSSMPTGGSNISGTTPNAACQQWSVVPRTASTTGFADQMASNTESMPPQPSSNHSAYQVANQFPLSRPSIHGSAPGMASNIHSMYRRPSINKSAYQEAFQSLLLWSSTNGYAPGMASETQSQSLPPMLNTNDFVPELATHAEALPSEPFTNSFNEQAQKSLYQQAPQSGPSGQFDCEAHVEQNVVMDTSFNARVAAANQMHDDLARSKQQEEGHNQPTAQVASYSAQNLSDLEQFFTDFD